MMENLNPCLKALDRSLRCAICFDYFNVCMITVCSHNYCSFCIRKYMTYKSQCPTCFEETSEPQLRNNRLVDELLKHYLILRETLRKCLRLEEPEAEEFVGKTEVPNYDQTLSCGVEEDEKKLSDSDMVCEESSRMPLAAASLPSPGITIPETTTSVSMTGSSTCEEYPSVISESRSFVDRVACPVCSVPVPPNNINSHLDKCLLREERKHFEKKKDGEKRKPIPKLVYHLLSDKDLKRKMKDFGLSTQGNRQSLIKRHKAFVVLYNSECDALQPLPVLEIIKKVEEQEKEEKVQATVTSFFQYDKRSDSGVIEEEQKKYLKQHDSQFQQLIGDAQKRQERKKTFKGQKAQLSSSILHRSNFQQIESKLGKKRDDGNSTFSDLASSSTRQSLASQPPFSISDSDEQQDDDCTVEDIISESSDQEKSFSLFDNIPSNFDYLNASDFQETDGKTAVKIDEHSKKIINYNDMKKESFGVKGEKIKGAEKQTDCDVENKESQKTFPDEDGKEPTSISHSASVKHVPPPVRGQLSMIRQSVQRLKRKRDCHKSSRSVLSKRNR
ncbi:E3 ubiquitin-protein ligase RAD18-like isoform X2 [Limulus polyphemus]|uniref:RING-type E3 ubiquitin transferase n=1 Tax=Limulus polyphemus TaxID=6850 RepID=A0ABM1T3F4_LIMPO|nr:E3 ubiquitin-protein ligase RAD18-like isoform X2 [Limulus polyphemus]